MERSVFYTFVKKRIPVSDQLIIALSVVNIMFSVYFQVVFKTSTYAGLVGIFTAQRQNQFTLSIDERGTATNLF